MQGYIDEELIFQPKIAFNWDWLVLSKKVIEKEVIDKINHTNCLLEMEKSKSWKMKNEK